MLTVIGSETYSSQRNLLSPTKPSEKSFAQLVEVLKKHLNPKPIIIAERYKFYKRSQQTGESINQYLSELRKMTVYCEFGDFLEEAVRDRFICGMNNAGIRKRLLSEIDLTLEKATTLALSFGASAYESELMKKESQQVYKVHINKRRCYRCNEDSHLANTCKHKYTKSVTIAK